jgi:exonuclease III
VHWNSNGLTTDRLDNNTVAFLLKHDIIAIWETQNNKAISTHLRDYSTFPNPDQSTTRGSGATIAVHNRLASTCRFVGWHQHIPLAWLKIQSCYIAFIYARPKILETAQQRADFFAHLHAEILHKQSFGQVILVGDINAHLGDLDDGAPLHRVHSSDTPNTLGRMFIDLTSRCHMWTTTGRITDNACISWHKADEAGHILEQSRLDHAFVQEDLWTHIHAAHIYPDFFGSDHEPLVMHFSVPDLDHTKLPLPAPYLRWNFHRLAQYSAAVNDQSELWQQLNNAIATSNLDMAAGLLSSIVWNAASLAGMIVDPSVKRKLALKLPTSALHIQRAIRTYRKRGLHVPASLRAQWRHFIFVAKQQQHSTRRKRMRRFLHERPRTFWTYYTNRSAHVACGISIDAWQDYYMGVFGSSDYIGHGIYTSCSARTAHKPTAAYVSLCKCMNCWLHSRRLVLLNALAQIICQLNSSQKHAHI